MKGNGGMNSLHIRMCPCEDVMVLSEGVLDPLSGDLCPLDPIIAIGRVHGWTQGGMHPPGWSLLLVLSGSIGERLTGCHIGQFAHPWVFEACETVPMWLTTDACIRSAELPGSTRIRLTSKSPISRDMMRASRCGCNIRVGSNGGKMIVPSMGRGPPPVIPGQMELIRSHRCGPQQLLSLSFGVILLVRWASVNIVYNGIGDGWGPRGSRVVILGKRLYLRHLRGGASLAMISFGWVRSEGVLMFCLCRAEYKYCPTKASDRVVGPIICGEFGHDESPWGLVMNDMRAERRGEHVVQSFANGAKWVAHLGGATIGSGCASQVVAAGGLGLLGSSRFMGVGGSCGLTLYASGMAPAVPGYIDSSSGLEFATWPFDADDGEAPSTKSWMCSTAFSSLNLSVSWRRACSCRSFANCLLSMA
ncbi:hypothetical protein CK203_029629 [Vitis vinifera]|uniref:Uncharacterized protein n=1 Tax=Vitis vinifera TaxID=29760 RepID=A0A438IID0_VITVI|nr:hypothetical protein CK203_029629 [Vitis vinifera]